MLFQVKFHDMKIFKFPHSELATLNDLLFVMFTFVSGAQGCFLFAFGLSVELVGAKRKTLIGNLIQAPFAFGEAFVGLIAMGIRDKS